MIFFMNICNTFYVMVRFSIFLLIVDLRTMLINCNCKMLLPHETPDIQTVRKRIQFSRYFHESHFTINSRNSYTASIFVLGNWSQWLSKVFILRKTSIVFQISSPEDLPPYLLKSFKVFLPLQKSESKPWHYLLCSFRTVLSSWGKWLGYSHITLWVSCGNVGQHLLSLLCILLQYLILFSMSTLLVDLLLLQS